MRMGAHVDQHGVGGISGLGRLWFVVLSLFVIGYAFLAGIRTLSEFDLGWLLATGRWIGFT